MYQNNLNFRVMSKTIDSMAGANANQILELTNKIAAAQTDEERKQYNDQLNQIVLDSHRVMNTYSGQAGALMAGPNRQDLFPAEGQTITTPRVVDGYVPTVNNKGEVVIDLANGTTQTFDLEMLVDFYTDSPEDFKKLPTQVQNYVSDIADKFFVDGQMIEPKREDFLPGRAGDQAFKDFTRIYNIFFPDTTDSFFEDVEKLEPTPKTKIQKDDITQLKKDKQTGDEIKIEELPPANTIIPKKKPDQPEEPKEKSLQEKIKEDFGNPNVGTSGGDTTVKEDVKSDTQRQTEDVFEGSGVEPMYQSASLKEKYGEGGTTFQKLTKNKNMEFAYNYLNKTLSPEASAALLGNMYAEGGNFAFDQEEVTDRKNKGYGLFQFTDVRDGEGHRTEYFKYLQTNDKQDLVMILVQVIEKNYSEYLKLVQ